MRQHTLDLLRSLPDESVKMVCTSPPYWDLRSYLPDGHVDKHLEIGLEPTPEEYVARLVAVFREVRRVLADDGTLWLNLGDSYNSSGSSGGLGGSGLSGGQSNQAQSNRRGRRLLDSLKPKDLVGIPWMVAFALRAPYYTGAIKNERDRIWLAAMLDAEGCIFIHKRKAGQNNGQGYERVNDNFAPGVEIANTSQAVVERCLALVGKGSICTQSPEQNGRRRQTLFRWSLRTTECRSFLAEVYPCLVAKQQQARIALGCPSSGGDAAAAHAALIGLHHGSQTTVDFPAPDPLFQPHPTVKNTELMRWLGRLITPPGGTILDCFAGSGSTGVAALIEGFSFLGIERSEEYAAIARARIRGDSPLFNMLEP